MLLRRRNIPFHARNRRIRYISIHRLLRRCYSFNILRCFPHILNLACKAVLGAITSLEYVQDIDYNPLTAARRDPVAVLRQAIRAVSSLIHTSKIALIMSYHVLDQSVTPPTSVLQCSSQNVDNGWPPTFAWCWYTMVIDFVDDWTRSWVAPGELSSKSLLIYG